MNWFCFAAGILLVVGTVLDALWTTLWVDGHAGPLTRRFASGIRKAIWWVVPRDNHRLLSLTGPIVMMSSVTFWSLMLLAGWSTLFSAEPGAVVRASTGAPATVVDRIYYTGASMFTLGSADFDPVGDGWKLATAATGVTGLFLVTLAVTYLLAILGAVTSKRAFAGHVIALGGTPQDSLLHAWNGREFPLFELQIVSLTEQLSTVAEQHKAYPILHYYHEESSEQSVPVGLALFDEILVLLEHGVAPHVRPAPAVLHTARTTVRLFLGTLKSAYVSAAREPMEPPRLERLRTAGIPVVKDDEFAAALADEARHRRLLQGFLDEENRDWPLSAPGDPED